jgi:hypothetical protein
MPHTSNLIRTNPTDPNSLALTVIQKASECEKKFFAGDPATMFHELRRFLFFQGVDSKLYSASRLPTAAISSQSGSALMGVFSVDNAFFSEFRSMVALESAVKRTVVNTLVFVLRVFIDSEGDGNRGTVQMMLNHLHDGIFELEPKYSALIQFLSENHWEQHQSSSAGRQLSLTSSMVFQREFSGVHQFASMFHRLKPILEFHQMVGSHLPIEAPF